MSDASQRFPMFVYPEGFFETQLLLPGMEDEDVDFAKIPCHECGAQGFHKMSCRQDWRTWRI